MQFESSRRSKRSISGTLFVTFLFGVAIGFSLCYGLVVSLGWGGADVETREETPTLVPPPEPVALEEETPVETELPAPPPEKPASPYDVASDLTFDEEVLAGRHLFVAIHGAGLDDPCMAFLGKLQPGGVVLRDENLTDTTDPSDWIKTLRNAVSQASSLADRPLCAVFPEPGRLARFGESNTPSAAELGAKWDTAQVSAIGREFGMACLERGVNVVLSPCLDIYEPDGEHAALATEAFGTEQGVVAAMGLAMLEGLSSTGAAALAMQYPGLGAARLNAEKDLWIIDRDVPQLAELMYPFAEAIAHGLPGVLVSHAAVPALDKAQPDRPASMSPVLIREVLRANFKFTGVVVADDVAPPAHLGGRTPADAAVDALAAGCDALLFLEPDPVQIHGICKNIEAAVSDGRLSKADLDASKERLDAWAEGLRERFAIPATPAEDTTTDAPKPDEAAVEPPPPPPEKAIEVTHIVEAGDVLCDLAKRFGVTVEELKQWNNLSDDRLVPAMELVARIPEKEVEREVATPEDCIEKEHLVQAEEELFDIAAAHDVTVLDVLRWNALTDGHIEEGRTLKVFAPPPKKEPEPKKPEPTTLHRIAPGETLEGLARRYGTTTKKLMELNKIKNPHKILFGQKLKVPKP